MKSQRSKRQRQRTDAEQDNTNGKARYSAAVDRRHMRNERRRRAVRAYCAHREGRYKRARSLQDLAALKSRHMLRQERRIVSTLCSSVEPL